MNAPVVLVPGMLCDADLWSDVVTHLGVDALEVAIDAPTIDGMAEQVLAAAPDDFILVGLSLGAIVGFEVLARRPDRLVGLCVLSTNAAAPTPSQERAWGEMATRTRSGGFRDVVLKAVLPQMFSSDAPPAALGERFLAMAERVGPQTFCAQLAAQATRRAAFGALSRMRCPTLVVSAAQDRLCPPSFHDAIASSAPRASLVSVPGAGHLCTWERPDLVGILLSRWLSTVSTPARPTEEKPCPYS